MAEDGSFESSSLSQGRTKSTGAENQLRNEEGSTKKRSERKSSGEVAVEPSDSTKRREIFQQRWPAHHRRRRKKERRYQPQEQRSPAPSGNVKAQGFTAPVHHDVIPLGVDRILAWAYWALEEEIKEEQSRARPILPSSDAFLSRLARAEGRT